MYYIYPCIYYFILIIALTGLLFVTTKPNLREIK